MPGKKWTQGFLKENCTRVPERSLLLLRFNLKVNNSVNIPFKSSYVVVKKESPSTNVISADASFFGSILEN